MWDSASSYSYIATVKFMGTLEQGGEGFLKGLKTLMAAG
jgi:hypothetical protein